MQRTELIQAWIWQLNGLGIQSSISRWTSGIWAKWRMLLASQNIGIQWASKGCDRATYGITMDHTLVQSSNQSSSHEHSGLHRTTDCTFAQPQLKHGRKRFFFCQGWLKRCNCKKNVETLQREAFFVLFPIFPLALQMRTSSLWRVLAHRKSENVDSLVDVDAYSPVSLLSSLGAASLIFPPLFMDLDLACTKIIQSQHSNGMTWICRPKCHNNTNWSLHILTTVLSE